jgi:Fe-S cluster assembly protein SufD
MSAVAEPGRATSVDRYVAAFESMKDRRPAGPRWLQATRETAIRRFVALGIPTTKDEEYRFTNVSPIAEAPFERSDDAVRLDLSAVEPYLFGTACAAELVFVNGRPGTESGTELGTVPLTLRGGLSPSNPGLTPTALPEGVTVSTLSGLIASGGVAELEPYLGRIADCDRAAFTALNTALFEDAAVVFIAPGVVLEAPVNLVFVSTAEGTPSVSFPRVLIVAGENSQSTFVETHVGLGGDTYFSCAVTEVVCGEHAIVDHYRAQLEQSHGYHYCRLQVRARRSSTFLSHAFSLGGAIVRNDLGADLMGEGIDCTLNGLYLADGDTLVDNHTTINHAQPHCGSHEVYKGILGGRARGIFNGKIIVAKDAQKTDAKQTNKAMLLSDAAQMNTKPQLEIFADDVKCTHGATVGQLDADSLFYLQARGLDRNTARAILIRGFAGDVVERVKFGPLRERLDQWLLEQIPQDTTASSS